MSSLSSYWLDAGAAHGPRTQTNPPAGSAPNVGVIVATLGLQSPVFACACSYCCRALVGHELRPVRAPATILSVTDPHLGGVAEFSWRAAVLNVVLGGDLVRHTPDVAGDERALSSVAVGPSACGTAGVKRTGALPEPLTLPPPQRLGPSPHRR